MKRHQIWTITIILILLFLFSCFVFITEAIADGDAVRGEQIFKKCKVCHTTAEGAKRRIGPNLFDIMGSEIANKSNFKYSKALMDYKSNSVWDQQLMYQWLQSPSKFAKGTKMAFPGLRKDEDLKDIIAYLKTLTN